MNDKDRLENCGGDTATPLLLNATTAQNLISPFFPKLWAALDPQDINVREIEGGMINTLHLVRRRDKIFSSEEPDVEGEEEEEEEPRAILIRHFGKVEGKAAGDSDGGDADGDELTLSTAEQAIVCYESGRRGWGPKLYGCFPGGRLEEWVENSHPLTSAESLKEEVRRGVAGAYARLHSLELPIRRDGFERVVVRFKEGVRGKRGEVLRVLGEVKGKEAEVYAGVFGRIDWIGELEWIVSLFRRFECRKTITHGDSNYLNILVRHDQPERGGDLPVMLIDYETVGNGYRGVDIGGHFNERMYCYTQVETQLTGFLAPSQEEQKMFCGDYLEAMRGLQGSKEEGDTVEKLLLEARIGQLYHLLFVNLVCTVFDDVEVEGAFLAALGHMMGRYEVLKGEFVRDYLVGEKVG